MAKVEGPLFSLEARGKIGNAMVFFPWKGRHAVRRWLKPTNPRDADQKIVRQKMAAIGKAVAAITSPGAVLVNGAAAVVAWKAKTPATQIWNAYLVSNCMKDLAVEANFTAFSAAMMGTDTIGNWRAQAAILGFATLLSSTGKYATDITPEIQFAMAAYAAYKVELSTATDIYSSYPSTWTTDQIDAFAADFTVAY